MADVPSLSLFQVLQLMRRLAVHCTVTKCEEATVFLAIGLFSRTEDDACRPVLKSPRVVPGPIEVVHFCGRLKWFLRGVISPAGEDFLAGMTD